MILHHFTSFYSLYIFIGIYFSWYRNAYYTIHIKCILCIHYFNFDTIF